MQAPLIHLNGSGRERLLDQIRDAAHAVREAEVTLAQTMPHRRDYYPIPGGGDWEFDQAIGEYASRMNRLHSVYTELEELYFLIEEAGR